MLHIEPRDDFGNNCVFDVNDDPTKVCIFEWTRERIFLLHPLFTFQGYCVEIFDLNDMPLEKLVGAITLAYDKVNSRVTVQALFPEPICLKAIISFEGQKLPNGDFDIIVLSSKSSTAVW